MMAISALKTTGSWVTGAIVLVLHGIRGIWRISRTPYRRLEKKYIPVKIATTIIKIGIIVYLLTFMLTVVISAIFAFALVASFFSSA